MVIPANLVRLVRELAASKYVEAHNQFELLLRNSGPEHPHTIQARLVLEEAAALNQLANPGTSERAA